MNKTALAWSLVATSFVLAAAVPFLDYRGSGFFALLALEGSSPIVLIAISLCAAFFYAAIDGWARLRQRDFSFIRLLALSTAFLACNVLLIRSAISPIGLFTPRWLSGNVLYSAFVHTTSLLLIALLLPLMLGTPLGGLILGLVYVSRRQWFGLKYLAVVVVWFACYSAGSRVNDLLTVNSCVPGIESALRATRDGRALPHMSQSFPFGVLDAGRQVAVCSLNGPLFDAQYIAYDPADPSPALETARLGKLLDGGSCDVRARRIRARYFWIGEAC